MLNFLFYRIFKFQKNIIGTSMFESAFVSVTSISLYAAMNIISIFFFFDREHDFFIKLATLGRWTENIIYGIFATVILIIFYFILFHKKKYLKIIKEIESKTKKENRKANISAILYQVFSILFFIIALIYDSY